MENTAIMKQTSLYTLRSSVDYWIYMSAFNKNPCLTLNTFKNFTILDPQQNWTLHKTWKIKHKPLNSAVTIVTAYFDIGEHAKGSLYLKRSEQEYTEWMKWFRFVNNPVVLYTDKKDIARHMQLLRANLSLKTKVFLINRDLTWAFSIKDKIREIYSMKDYPIHHPNTVIPEYSCSMHAKYELVSKAAKENYFYTSYFAWVDIGYFRDIIESEEKFSLQLPEGFDSSAISVNLVFDLPLNTSISEIIKDNLVWIGGGLFLGNQELIVKYVEQYKRSVKFFLSQNLMNTDQQMLYAMYSEEGRRKLNTSIVLQMYGSNACAWFHLGYIMRKITD